MIGERRRRQVAARGGVPRDRGDRRPRALPPYGEGITYWPIVEVLKQLDVLPADDPAAADPLAARRERRRHLAEEIAWAFRKP